jgi:hypothetical protein
MENEPKKKRKPQESTKISLHPLSFEEALKKILRFKPENGKDKDAGD